MANRGIFARGFINQGIVIALLKSIIDSAGFLRPIVSIEVSEIADYHPSRRYF
jgi:hypothetical protein